MSQLPLAGRRILEMGTMVAAPFATHILAQLGAEVVKVNYPFFLSNGRKARYWRLVISTQ